MVGAVLWVLEGVESGLERADVLRFFFSSADSAQRIAFDCRFRFCRRWTVPLLNTAAVILAMCAIVARGAFSTVSWARAAASAFCDFDFDGERVAGDDRLIFSTRGVLDGEGVRDGVSSTTCFAC